MTAALIFPIRQTTTSERIELHDMKASVITGISGLLPPMTYVVLVTISIVATEDGLQRPNMHDAVFSPCLFDKPVPSSYCPTLRHPCR
jgi:hypothetical protein